MRTLLAILSLACASCGPYIDAKRGIVSAGFMSRTVAFAGKLKTPDGTTASWSVQGTDSTDVPIAGINAIVTYGAAKFAVEAQQSNNATEVSKGAQGVQINNSDNATKVLLNGQNTGLEAAKIIKP